MSRKHRHDSRTNDQGIHHQLIQPHRSAYLEPITCSQGTLLQIGQLHSGPKDWPNWLWCVHVARGKAGWALLGGGGELTLLRPFGNGCSRYDAV